MYYIPDILLEEDGRVYPPSEDSVFLVRCLEIIPGERVLEIGCGSGVVSLHCARAGALVTAGDINPFAVELTKRNAESNGLNIDVTETDVYSSISGTFDTIIFNLPYLPVDDDCELSEAWSGGEGGLGPLPELLSGAADHGNKGWRVVVVVSSLMDTEKLDALLAPYSVKVLGELPLFFEKLRVLQISPYQL
ncbi:MAG: HemK2/MTQ2 family protein methyltransferase [Candidatus Methanomethylophilaceae archaeon]|nr:release factor glutamine methyltransferase [Candidatus Methanomethylophilaceae archaeon]